MHEKRRARLGAATARFCTRCREVVDDGDSAEMSGQGSWVCMPCLVKRGIIRRGDRVRRGDRERLPLKRATRRYKFRYGGTPGYIETGIYPDGRVGEVFIVIQLPGSAYRAIMEAWAVSISKSLQFGTPLREIIESYEKAEGDTQFFSCDALPTLHRREYKSIWAALVAVLEAETNKDGVHVDFAKEKNG